MKCFVPIQAYKPDLGGSLIFSERAGYRPVFIRCGQCTGCRLTRACGWAIRCLHEGQCHEWSSFVTLTYDDIHVPRDASLCYKHFQLFMRRIRRRFPECRFYMAGEYGEENGRPHYHAILFGVHFYDRYYWRESPAGFSLFRSKLLESCWKYGASEIGDLSFESAGYIARYCMKKVTGKLADEHYKRVDENGEVYWLVPEFNHMSLKPGIGAKWFEKYKKQVYPRDYIIVDGRKLKPPKYYDKLIQEEVGTLFDDVEFERYKKSLELIDDSTPDRLLTQRIVAEAGLKFKMRTL